MNPFSEMANVQILALCDEAVMLLLLGSGIANNFSENSEYLLNLWADLIKLGRDSAGERRT